jgi:glycosyltransferase involved in cell wall biosynthesis
VVIQRVKIPPTPLNSMKLGYFSPLIPVKSGISEYSEREVLPYLKKYFEIDLIIDKKYKPSSKFINENFKVIPYDEFENKYDLLIYHMGNNPFHEYMYKIALSHPGIVVLHDPFLHHLQVHMTVAQNDQSGYRKIMEYCIGPKGKKIADNALISYIWPHFEYPLIKKLVDSSTCVIVHSEFAKKIILKETKKYLIKQIKMPITTTLISVNNDLKKQLGISKNSLIVGSFGHVGFYKRIDVSLKSFAVFLKSYPDSVFLIVGEYQSKAYEKEIHQLIKELEIKDNVIETGYVENLFPYVEISDIILQLRYPTAGETSIITLQIMGLGKPLLVSNVGSFSELPDNSVIKIDVDSNEQTSMTSALLKLSVKNSRDQLSQNAKIYVETEHSPEKIAYEFFNFVSHIKNTEKMKIITDASLDIKNSKNFVSSQNLSDLVTSIHKRLS